MKRFGYWERLSASIIVWSTLALSACGSIHIPSIPTPHAPDPPPIVTPTCERSLDVRDAAGGADVAVTVAGVKWTGVTNSGGYVVFQAPCSTTAHVEVTHAGYVPVNEDRQIPERDNFGISVPMKPTAQPWETVTTDQLRAWRGSISTTLAAMPCGPRPNQSNNVMFTAQFDSSCWGVDDRTRAIDAYSAKAWVHWPIGPADSHGYHGAFPDMSWIGNPDGFADRMEQLWRAGKIPALFLLPDTGYCADGQSVDWMCVEANLTPFYSNPRIQAMARVVVLAWEPEFAHDDFLKGAQWMARVFPHARRGIHLPSGHAATCRGSELVEAGGRFPTEGSCWTDIAPLIHFYAVQETWVFGGEAAPGRTPKQQFLYDLWDIGRRLTDCYAGWPCAGADGKPVDVVAFEYASYYVTNDPSRAREADEWGDAAISAAPFTDPASGQTIDAAKYVVGYGDGGTVDPMPRLPRRTFSLMSSTAPHFTFSFIPSR